MIQISDSPRAEEAEEAKEAELHQIYFLRRIIDDKGFQAGLLLIILLVKSGLHLPEGGGEGAKDPE